MAEHRTWSNSRGTILFCSAGADLVRRVRSIHIHGSKSFLEASLDFKTVYSLGYDRAPNVKAVSISTKSRWQVSNSSVFKRNSTYPLSLYSLPCIRYAILQGSSLLHLKHTLIYEFISIVASCRLQWNKGLYFYLH